jgi:hypothetical protein
MNRYWFIRQLLIKRTRVMYLIIIDKIASHYEDIIKLKTTEQFDDMVYKHVNEYATKGIIPPEEIAPAIMNIYDDMASGRDISMRAGDYISLVNFAKKNQIL